MLYFLNGTLKQIQSCAENEYPAECCGILVGLKQGADKIVYRVCPIENTAAEKETHFYIDPLETFKAEITAEFDQLEIVGFYHSHPNFKAIPSCEDKDFMIEGYAYPIISVRNGKFEEIRCFEKEINNDIVVLKETIVREKKRRKENENHGLCSGNAANVC